MAYVLNSALELGLLYALIPLALFMSYRILDIADLSTDGTFVLGMAISVACCLKGHPLLGLILGMLGGGCGGLVTAFLQTFLDIPSILAGIITNTGLYTINLMVMGFSSNLSILKEDTIFTFLKSIGISKLVFFGAIDIILICLLVLFLKTRLGLSLRATGNNKTMVKASSINPKTMIAIGLFLANMLTGLCGGLVGQMQKSSDINSGTGIVVIGLACLIIGETIVSKKNMTTNCIAAVVGSIVYRFIYAFILKTSLIPIECLKLMMAFILALAIGLPYLKQKAKQNARRVRRC